MRLIVAHFFLCQWTPCHTRLFRTTSSLPWFLQPAPAPRCSYCLPPPRWGVGHLATLTGHFAVKLQFTSDRCLLPVSWTSLASLAVLEDPFFTFSFLDTLFYFVLAAPTSCASRHLCQSSFYLFSFRLHSQYDRSVWTSSGCISTCHAPLLQGPCSCTAPCTHVVTLV